MSSESHNKVPPPLIDQGTQRINRRNGWTVVYRLVVVLLLAYIAYSVRDKRTFQTWEQVTPYVNVAQPVEVRIVR